MKLIKKNFRLHKVKRTVYFFLLFCCGCSNSEKSDERLFLENVMIRENGLYVLMGSKPMCNFPINHGYPETEEERKKSYEDALSKDGGENSYEDYENYSKDCQKLVHLHHRRLWDAWQKKMQDYVALRYKFVSRKIPNGDYEDGLFINIASTLYVLKSHYEDFAKIIGMHFDPNIILNEIGDNNSSFWEKAFQSHYLMGLLFGYGKRNAFLYNWGVESGISIPKVKIKDQRDIDQIVEISFKKNVKLSDLRLPLFGVYSVDDSTIARYRKEREMIIQELNGRNFMEVVTQWLFGDQNLEKN